MRTNFFLFKAGYRFDTDTKSHDEVVLARMDAKREFVND